jgi:excinuclease ABC subunit A
LGPEGGEEGGQLLYAGKPEGILKIKESYTGQYLKEKL